MASIAITKTEVFIRATKTFTVQNGPTPNVRDYVAIYLAGAPAYLVWSYLNNGRDAAHRPPKGLATGTVTFANLSPGNYEAKLFSLTDAGVATLLETMPFGAGAPSTSGGEMLMNYQVENLPVGESIGDGTAANARTIFTALKALTFTSKLSISSQGAPAGIDDANTVVINCYRGTSLIVSKTYNKANPFPADHAQSDLGALANNVFKAGDDLRLACVCGPTANPPSFLIQGEFNYVI